MGGLETEAKKVRRRGQIQKALLTTLLIGGMIAIGATPRINILKLLGNKKRNQYRLKHQVNDALIRLSRKGLVAFVIKEGRKFARLTPAGSQRLKLEQEKAALLLQRKKRWDKRWRVIIFDIPERRRGVRSRLRAIMQECGFVRLQDSVWVYPHDCEDLTVLMKAELKTGSSILYMVVEKIENDAWLKKHFSIK